MRKRRNDRDVRQSAGVRQFNRTSGYAAPQSYRDFEHLGLYPSAESAVYPSVERARQRKPTQLFVSLPAKRAKHFVGTRLVSPSVRIDSAAFPSRVLFCVRRKQRRETLFAIRRAGYSGSAPKRHYYRKLTSSYGC